MQTATTATATDYPALISSAHRAYIRSRLQPADADDVLQSVLIRLWQIDQRGGLPANPTPLVWLILHGRITDLRRSRSSRREAQSDTLGEVATSTDRDDGPGLDVEPILNRAGSCRSAVKRRFLSDAPCTGSDRKLASRGIARIRESLGICVSA